MSLDRADMSERVRLTEDFGTLGPGQIAAVHADVTGIARKLADYTGTGHTFALYFIDPWGPKAIPLTFVRQIVGLRRHDTIINFPYYDLSKIVGFTTKEERRPGDEGHIRYFTEAYGNDRWIAIARELARRGAWDESTPTRGDSADAFGQLAELGPLEDELIGAYRSTLEGVDPDLIVKSIGLRFPDRERTMFHLYLTTRDADGALEMNRVLAEAGYREHELRWRLKMMRTQKAKQTSFLFPQENLMPPPKVVPRASAEQIAADIWARFQGKAVSFKDVCRGLATELHYKNEIQQALGHMRENEGRAAFDGAPSRLTSRALITFAQPPAAATRRTW